jgi:hypothetical protein
MYSSIIRRCGSLLPSGDAWTSEWRIVLRRWVVLIADQDLEYCRPSTSLVRTYVTSCCGTVWTTPFSCHFYQHIFKLTEIMASVTGWECGRNGMNSSREKRGDYIRWLYRRQEVLFRPGMSNRGYPEGRMGHICVVMRATHDMRPAGRMFDMPDIEYVFFIHNFFKLGNSLSFPSVKIILNKEKHWAIFLWTTHVYPV